MLYLKKIIYSKFVKNPKEYIKKCLGSEQKS